MSNLLAIKMGANGVEMRVVRAVNARQQALQTALNEYASNGKRTSITRYEFRSLLQQCQVDLQFRYATGAWSSTDGTSINDIHQVYIG